MNSGDFRKNTRRSFGARHLAALAKACGTLEPWWNPSASWNLTQLSSVRRCARCGCKPAYVHLAFGNGLLRLCRESDLFAFFLASATLMGAIPMPRFPLAGAVVPCTRGAGPRKRKNHGQEFGFFLAHASWP